jgi:hypothetical protein
MRSFEEAYSRRRTGRDRRRVAGGAGLGFAGAAAVLGAISLVAVAGDTTAAKQYAGVLAGLGTPAMLLAVVVVLPASWRNRAGVVVGSGLTVIGVVVFWHAYPTRWSGAADPLVFETAVVYGLGGAVALAFVFLTVATFRRRNSPQGTVRLAVNRDSGTETVEVSQREYRRVRRSMSDGGDPEQILEDLLDE